MILWSIKLIVNYFPFENKRKEAHYMIFEYENIKRRDTTL